MLNLVVTAVLVLVIGFAVFAAQAATHAVSALPI